MATQLSTQYPRIDYAARDFILIRTALLDYLTSQLPDKYTDFAESDLGIMLLELYSWVGDMLSLALDMQANECYLPTARQRQNIVNIVKLIGYIPNPPAAASVELYISTPTPAGFTEDAVISAGTSITVGDKIFELLEDYTLPAGTDEAGPGSSPYLAGPTFAEGRSFADTFVGNNEPNQFYKLAEFPVIRNSIEVFVNSIQWEQVSAIVFAGDTNSYALDFDGEEAATIRFGNGISGRMPQLGDSIEIQYRVGGGKSGNVAANVINTSLQATLQISLGIVNISATNPNSASGGDDEESIDSIKLNAPRYIRTHGNAITKSDYDTLASQFVDPTYGAIAKAVAFPRYGQTNSSANEVDVWVWARDSSDELTVPTVGLKHALLDYLNARKVIVVDIFINDGGLVSIDVHVDVYLSISIKDAEVVTAEVEAVIREFFKRESLQPSETFYVSELYREIMNITGVQQTNIGIPGSPLAPTQTLPVSGPPAHPSPFTTGVTTTLYVVTPGLTPNAYASGILEVVSGSLSGRRFPILTNGIDNLKVDGVLDAILPGDSVTISSQLEPMRDVPVADDEIYKLGNLTINAFIRTTDTRDSVIVASIV